MSGWDYEGYWQTVLGADRTPTRVVAEFSLVAAGLDEWLGTAEAEAWSAGGGRAADLPAEWTAHHARALRELQRAVSEAAL